jgi:hypothetical protein
MNEWADGHLAKVKENPNFPAGRREAKRALVVTQERGVFGFRERGRFDYKMMAHEPRRKPRILRVQREERGEEVPTRVDRQMGREGFPGPAFHANARTAPVLSIDESRSRAGAVFSRSITKLPTSVGRGAAISGCNCTVVSRRQRPSDQSTPAASGGWGNRRNATGEWTTKLGVTGHHPGHLPACPGTSQASLSGVGDLPATCPQPARNLPATCKLLLVGATPRPLGQAPPPPQPQDAKKFQGQFSNCGRRRQRWAKISHRELMFQPSCHSMNIEVCRVCSPVSRDEPHRINAYRASITVATMRCRSRVSALKRGSNQIQRDGGMRIIEPWSNNRHLACVDFWVWWGRRRANLLHWLCHASVRCQLCHRRQAATAS